MNTSFHDRERPSGPPEQATPRDAGAARKELARRHVLTSLGILDTPPEAFTDAVVSAAAAIANVPFALVSLLDEHRQWFKSAWGTDVTETPRDTSFCTHAILATRPLIVEDAWLDPRFKDNPSVRGDPHVRFYAGFPLIVDGHAMGTLCVVDDHPRRLTAEQSDRLTTLAAGTATWLARRSRTAVR